MSFPIGDYFCEPLRDMGLDSPELEGIWIPQSELGTARVGVTDQFLANADDYHARYTNVAYFQGLLERAFAHLGAPDPKVVLDIGSGSGNSVFGCLELLPATHVVATDISPQLLCILRDGINERSNRRGRVTPVCMSATRNLYASGAFGLAVGAAILHHLPDPGAAIRAIGEALAPGGFAIFFEPFENGNAILRLAYGDLLERARHKKRAAKGVGLKVIAAMERDFAVRAGIGPDHPRFLELDDKWLFTRSMLEDYASAAGFRRIEIEPLHDTAAPFSAQTRINLSLAAGLGPEALPDWCWERLAFYDAAFSDGLKCDLLIEGRVIFHK